MSVNLRLHIAWLKGSRSWREFAQDVGIEHAYLYRLGTGERIIPGPDILRRLGLKQVVAYEYLADLSGVPATVKERLHPLVVGGETTAGKAPVTGRR